MAVPLAWPRRQPDFCRERNRRRRRFVVGVVVAGCTPGRSPVGLRLPGEGNNQPQRGRVRCTSARPRSKIVHPETISDPWQYRFGEISPKTDHPTRPSRAYVTPTARTDPRRIISPAASDPNLVVPLHLERPPRSSRQNFTASARLGPQGELPHRAPSLSHTGLFHLEPRLGP